MRPSVRPAPVPSLATARTAGTSRKAAARSHTRTARSPPWPLSPPRYPLAARGPLSLDDLLTAELLLREPGSAIRDAFDSALLLRGRCAEPAWTSVNSPALAAADVSVAMRDASDLAREVADITLLSSDLRELAALRRLSQRMLERINRNYRSILTINTSLLALGIFGILPPTTTALLHNASTMAISAASMRPYLPAPGGRGAQGKEPGNETA